MEVMLHAKGENYRKLKDRLLTDDIVNRASIIFKEASQFGLEGGYLCIVKGTDERCEKALELAKADELAEEIMGNQKEEILKKIKEEENKAIEGFGGIFG